MPHRSCLSNIPLHVLNDNHDKISRSGCSGNHPFPYSQSHLAWRPCSRSGLGCRLPIAFRSALLSNQACHRVDRYDAMLQNEYEYDKNPMAFRLPSGLTDLLHPDCFWSQARACLISGVVHGNGEAQPFQPVPWEGGRWKCLGSRGYANRMAKTNIPLTAGREFVLDVSRLHIRDEIIATPSPAPTPTPTPTP